MICTCYFVGRHWTDYVFVRTLCCAKSVRSKICQFNSWIWQDIAYLCAQSDLQVNDVNYVISKCAVVIRELPYTSLRQAISLCNYSRWRSRWSSAFIYSVCMCVYVWRLAGKAVGRDWLNKIYVDNSEKTRRDGCVVLKWVLRQLCQNSASAFLTFFYSFMYNVHAGA